MLRLPLIAALSIAFGSNRIAEEEPLLPPLVYELGGQTPQLKIPRGEHLQFAVHVKVGPVGATVGEVNIDSGVDQYMESMLLAPAADSNAPKRETGWLRAVATGSYMWYELSTSLDSRYLPLEWPMVSYFSRQSGSENRRRENKIGIREGKSQSMYRGDTSSGAPSGQRIWRKPEPRDVPEGTVDMLGAVFLARTLLDGEKQELVFPLLDKTRLWKMTLKRGTERRMTVPLGEFDAVEILLIPSTWPGEPEAEAAKFRGLFGIRGSIHLWVEKNTGVPIRIVGTMPAGPLTIDCDIYLEAATGTPEAFQRLPVLKRSPEAK